jgi:hypothetical protein
MQHDGSYNYRLNPEIMIGVSRKLMLHMDLYGSNMYQANFKAEGGSVYGKYRLFSSDDVHSHFRLAAYGRISLIGNPTTLNSDYTFYSVDSNGQQEMHTGIKYITSDEIDLTGNNSGFQAGVVATKLAHKLAISSSVDYARRWDNLNASISPGQSVEAMNYSLSAGYLFLPFEYRDYRQTNFNIYCEWLGSSSLDKKAYFIDMAPAFQFIFNSISRMDIGYRFQVAGNMERLSSRYFTLRFEFNFLNAFGNNK